MTFDELAAAVRRVAPKRLLTETERILALPEGIEGLKRDISPIAVEVMLRLGIGPNMVPVGSGPVRPSALGDVEIIPPAPAKRGRARKEPAPQVEIEGTPQSGSEPEPKAQEQRGRPSVVGSELLKRELAAGPKSEKDIRAAADAIALPERQLLVAASSLGVTTRRGLWKLPGGDVA